MKKKPGLDYLVPEALKQGIFDQKTWEEKQSDQAKPNPTFNVNFGPGDILIHRPTVTNPTLDVGLIQFAA